MNTVTEFKRLKVSAASQTARQAAAEKQRKVLIAGGAGFLGSRLCSRYLEYGYEVTCLDNLSTGRLCNLKQQSRNPKFKFIHHDVVNPINQKGRYDFIFNMACPASPPKYQSDPIQTMKTSIYGAFNLLDVARRSNAKILQASTSEIYGDPDVTPQTERYQGNVNTVGPRSCYDEGKRAAESIFHDHRETYGTDIRIARIFNTYGPGMDPLDGRVVSNFINQALDGQPITIYGDGSQSRSFCYLDDMVDGLITLMHTTGTRFEPINIGNPDEFTMVELANLILKKITTLSRITYADLPEDDPKQRRPDISRAKKYLGWSPKIGLDQGLDRTIAYFKTETSEDNLSNPAVAR